MLLVVEAFDDCMSYSAWVNDFSQNVVNLCRAAQLVEHTHTHTHTPGAEAVFVFMYKNSLCSYNIIKLWSWRDKFVL